MTNGGENPVNGSSNPVNGPVLLRVEKLSVAFPRTVGGSKNVVDGISFSLREGEILGIAGESGSGKSMTALAVMGLLPEGARCSCEELSFAGENMRGDSQTGRENRKAKKEEERLRRGLSGREMAMIFQEPLTSLNPVLTIKKQMEEPLVLHTSLTAKAREARLMDALEKAELKHGEQLLNCYPHHLSGGMRQRVMIAMAMLNRPKLLIADEPTTALDAVTEREIVELIRCLAKENHTAVLFISHDLGVLRAICDRVMIMKNGKVIEEGTTEQIFEQPECAYTKRLMQAVVRGSKEAMSGKGAADCEATLSNRAEDIAKDVILSLREVSVTYKRTTGWFRKPEEKQAVKGVSFAVRKGEVFGIVGESGCGKSTLLKVISGLLEEYEGTVSTKTRVQMVFQDPYTSLNPAKRVGWILEEPLRLCTALTKEERHARVLELIKETELPEEVINRRVAELSGGQRQRVAIAAALITNPELVLLDEPVSALDVTVQAQILELLLRLQREHGLTYVFVSHDMAVIRKLCDRVLVMKDGCVVECAATEELFLRPREAYTRKLLGEETGKGGIFSKIVAKNS